MLWVKIELVSCRRNAQLIKCPLPRFISCFFVIKMSEWVVFLFGELHTVYVDLDLEFLVNVLVQITFRGAPLIFKWWKLNRFMNAEEIFRFWNSLHIILHFPRYNMKKSLLPCECGQSDYLQRNFNESKLNYIHADPRSFKKLEVRWKNIIICFRLA